MWPRDLWYFAAPASSVRRGKMRALTMLGEPLLVGRATDGRVFALRDICPHRAMPLSEGRFDGAEIECCYHGWRFGADGRCTAIPALTDGSALRPAQVRVRPYPVEERDGAIWVYFAGAGDGKTVPAPPTIPGGAAAPLRVSESMVFPCAHDDAVIGLMDPAHGPFVHAAWWWRGRKSLYEKEKRFAPSELGFTMCRHRPSTNSAAYRLLGGVPETEIAFRLPGVRIEHIRAGRHVLCGLTAVTPIDQDRTMVHHLIYWSMPWLTMLRPLLRPFVRAFLRQDRDIMARQRVGLAHNPPLMLIDGADTQAKWYFALKQAHETAVTTGKPFENPVEETALRWRS